MVHNIGPTTIEECSTVEELNQLIRSHTQIRKGFKIDFMHKGNKVTAKIKSTRLRIRNQDKNIKFYKARIEGMDQDQRIDVHENKSYIAYPDGTVPPIDIAKAEELLKAMEKEVPAPRQRSPRKGVTISNRTGVKPEESSEEDLPKELEQDFTRVHNKFIPKIEKGIKEIEKDAKRAYDLSNTASQQVCKRTFSLWDPTMGMSMLLELEAAEDGHRQVTLGTGTFKEKETTPLVDEELFMTAHEITGVTPYRQRQDSGRSSHPTTSTPDITIYPKKKSNAKNYGIFPRELSPIRNRQEEMEKPTIEEARKVSPIQDIREEINRISRMLESLMEKIKQEK